MRSIGLDTVFDIDEATSIEKRIVFPFVVVIRLRQLWLPAILDSFSFVCSRLVCRWCCGGRFRPLLGRELALLQLGHALPVAAGDVGGGLLLGHEAASALLLACGA